jgi:hypothetical protein
MFSHEDGREALKGSSVHFWSQIVFKKKGNARANTPKRAGAPKRKTIQTERLYHISATEMGVGGRDVYFCEPAQATQASSSSSRRWGILSIYRPPASVIISRPLKSALLHIILPPILLRSASISVSPSVSPLPTLYPHQIILQWPNTTPVSSPLPPPPPPHLNPF